MTKLIEEYVEQPREQLRQKGVQYLRDEQLVAILLGTGVKGKSCMNVSVELLNNVGGIVGLLNRGVGMLSDIEGVGEAKACRLVAAIELGLRVFEKQSIEKTKDGIRCSRDIFDRYKTKFLTLNQEVVWAIGLNVKNQIVHESMVSMGPVDECTVNLRELFRPLILESCANMVVMHNHPSGDATPSAEDVTLTKRILLIGEMMGISLLDHVVFGTDSYVSMRDMGIIG